MVTVSKPQAWSKSIGQPPSEFWLNSLPVLAGEIPPNLRGTLYRICFSRTIFSFFSISSPS